MCGKLKDGHTTVTAVVLEEVKSDLGLLVKKGIYKSRSEAVGTILREAVEEALQNCKNQNQNEDSQESHGISSNGSLVKHTPLDKETFRKLPKTFQIFSDLLEKANSE